MTKKFKKITAIILTLAIVLSLAGCQGEVVENENINGSQQEVPKESNLPVETVPPIVEIPTETQTPSSGENVEVKETLSDAFGVFLYSYDTQYTPENSNYVVIRMDQDELLSKDLYILDIDVSYNGDGEFEDEDIIPDLEDGILVSESSMQKYFGTTYNSNYQVDYLVCLARDEEGEYFQVEYNNSEEYWQDCESETSLDITEEIYIGLPLKDSGEYETSVTFEIKDSQQAYDFGYFTKEVEDGEEFTLVGQSKISKSKAEVVVMSQITRYDKTEDTDATAFESQYLELSFESDGENQIADYIRVETDGKEDENALADLVKIIDFDEVYPYIYTDEAIENKGGNKTEIYLTFMEDTGVSTSVNQDNHIEENDLVWVNYEFTINEGVWYVFDDSNYESDNSSVGTAIDYIFSIEYEDIDSSDDVKYDFTASTQAVELAIETYEKLSSAEQAYLLSLDRSEIKALAFYKNSSGTPEELFGYWLKERTLSGDESYNGYDVIAYLESATEYLSQLEIVSDFKEFLEDYDLYDSESEEMVDFNKDSTTMISNLNVALLYLDEMSDEDLAVIKSRCESEYEEILAWEELIVSEDVEYVMSQITAVVANYLVSDLTNLLLYVDLDNSNSSVIGLEATHMIYSTSLFAEIERVNESFENLSPEKRELLSVWKMNVINGEESISNYKNQYYFNSKLISSQDFNVTFDITYANAISALVQMAEVAENLNEIFDYISYSSYFDTEIEKTRFIDLLFGDVDNGYNDTYFGNGKSLFFDQEADAEDQNNNFAMLDIANAYGESEDVQNAIIEEYKDFIELLIYIQDYKYIVADEFESIMMQEVTQDNDYSLQTVATMQSVIEDYIQAILEEDTSLISDEDCMKNVISYIMSEGFEDMEEAKELVQDCFDANEIAEYMIDTEKYEQE